MTHEQERRRRMIRWVIRETTYRLEGTASTREIEFVTGISKSSVQRHIEQMLDAGQLMRYSTGQGGLRVGFEAPED